MDFSILEQYFVLTVMIACLVVGYVLKQWVEDVDNKWIPTILVFVGAILNLFVSGMSIDSAVFGALMGLASVGLHQAFKQWVENRK